MIRKVKNSDYKQLFSLYRTFFSKHNIFSQSESEVVKYLKEESKKHDLIVYYDGEVRGALYLVNFGQNADGSHKLWKFRHFAFEDKDIGALLLAEAEKIVKKKSKTSKIELTIAESEKGIGLYKVLGYKKEGTLTNHYRFGENCYVFCKSFRR